jgi:hypothetical protein
MCLQKKKKPKKSSKKSKETPKSKATDNGAIPATTSSKQKTPSQDAAKRDLKARVEDVQEE